MTMRIPLVSSSTAGPLGVLHLTRLWAKAMPYVLDELPESNWCLTRGFDANLLEAFGASAIDCRASVESTLPNYQTFEAWMCHRAGSLNAAITTTNEVILTGINPKSVRRWVRENAQRADAAGIDAHNTALQESVTMCSA